MINIILNKIIKLLGNVLSLITTFLPSSPFQILDKSSISDYISGLNYFIPIGAMLSIFQAWGTAIALFYCYQAILRWIKAEN